MVHSPKCILLQSNVHSCLLPAEIPIFALGVAIHVYVERKKDFTYYHIPCIIDYCCTWAAVYVLDVCMCV